MTNENTNASHESDSANIGGNGTTTSSPKFELGRVVATPGALRALETFSVATLTLLNRHVHGDWGDLVPEDAKANDLALQDGGRLLSSYKLSDDCKVWIITEADRSSSCLLLPEEY